MKTIEPSAARAIPPTAPGSDPTSKDAAGPARRRPRIPAARRAGEHGRRARRRQPHHPGGLQHQHGCPVVRRERQQHVRQAAQRLQPAVPAEAQHLGVTGREPGPCHDHGAVLRLGDVLDIAGGERFREREDPEVCSRAQYEQPIRPVLGRRVAPATAPRRASPTRRPGRRGTGLDATAAHASIIPSSAGSIHSPKRGSTRLIDPVASGERVRRFPAWRTSWSTHRACARRTPGCGP